MYNALLLFRRVAAELTQELQVIISETHLVLSSISNDNPHRQSLLTINQAAKKAITLTRWILGLDELPL